MKTAADGSKIRRIGRALKQWREESPPLSMEELAAAIGKSLSTLQRWERGAQEPKTSDLQRMDRVKPGLAEALFPRLLSARRARPTRRAA